VKITFNNASAENGMYAYTPTINNFLNGILIRKIHKRILFTTVLIKLADRGSINAVKAPHNYHEAFHTPRDKSFPTIFKDWGRLRTFLSYCSTMSPIIFFSESESPFLGARKGNSTDRLCSS